MAKVKIDLSWIKPDQLCWIELPESDTQDPYLKAQIVSYDGKNVTYTSEHGSKGEIMAQKVFQRSNAQNSNVGFHDMINMEILNDAELLYNLLVRTKKNIIFTYVGPTLLAVNPFKYFLELYTPEVRAHYIKSIIQTHNAPMAYKELNPHIYSIAAEAYRSLLENHKNQTIVISGESGAGKTENAKFCMNLLTSIMGQSNQNLLEGAIEEKILKCNPILEAFGNAKTLRNNNSSRFGKYVKIVVEGGRIQGSLITNYLLEKCRITSPGPNERNFHIFYHLLAGSSPDELQRLYLSDGKKKRNMEEFKYLEVSKCFVVDSINDIQLYKEVVQAFQALNFQEYQGTVFSLVAAILHMGNIDFDDSNQGNNTPCVITDMRCATTVSQLLGLDVQQFQRITTTKTRQVGQDVIDSPYNRVECINGIQSFAREIYEKLFNWLVVKLNETITPKNIDNGLRYVGLLDIYGFEVFPTNTFEQMFINYTNEKLLQLYILYVFEEEQRTYIFEDLEKYVHEIQFTDNKEIIALLEKPGQGIFCVLDDSSAVAGTDETFLNKVKQLNQANSLFITPRIANKPVFTIKHTAKDVEYSVQGFRSKNKDEINKEITHQLSKSRNKLISQIFSLVMETKASDKYLSGKIRNEMTTLMNELSKCDVHFVRCVKPNENKKYGEFEQQIVLNQVKYLGVLETLKVRKESYPVRRIYQQFYQQYGEMSNNKSYPALLNDNADFRQLVIKIFQDYFTLDDKLVIFGKTRVFMRLQALDIIEIEYKKRVAIKNIMASKIQRAWHHYLALKKFRYCLAMIRRLQQYTKRFLLRLRFLKIVRATIFIQYTYRRFKEKSFVKRTKNATKVIQTYLKRVYAIKYIIVKSNALLRIQQIFRDVQRVRRMKTYTNIRSIVGSLLNRAWCEIQHKAATKIQALWRGYSCRKQYHQEVRQIRLLVLTMRANKAVLKIQTYFRGWMVRLRLSRLRRAVSYIQGWFRMRWLSHLFFRIRIAAIIIQRRVRAYLSRVTQQQMMLDSYLKPQEKRYLNYKHSEEQNFITQIKIPQSAKITLLNTVFDMEILTDMSDIYDSLWTTTFNRFQRETTEKLNFIQGIQIGETHTYIYTMLGKVYSWGLNDHGQLGSGSPLDAPNTSKHHLVQVAHTKQIQSGSHHGLFLTASGVVYALGSNRGGHCGVGHYRDVIQPQVVQLPPTKQIVVIHDQSIALTEDGLIYMWPQMNQNISNKPQQLKSWTNIIRMNNYLSAKLIVHQIAAGLKFLLILSTIGHIYSYGENTQGELGLGHGRTTQEPTMVENLNEKVVEISAGLKHAIARTSLGKVYVWGWGQKGQLGTGLFQNEYTPIQVKLNKKCCHVCAARTSTLCLMEDKRIMWWGTNGQLNYQHYPCETNTGNSPILILSQYSRTMSLITIIFANGDQSNIKNKKITQTLTQKWADTSPQSLDPPYCETLANHLFHGFMKRPVSKFQIKFTSKLEHQQIMKDIEQQNVPIILESDLKQPHIIIDQNLNYQEYNEPFSSFKLDQHSNQYGDASKSLNLHNQLFKKQSQPQTPLFEEKESLQQLEQNVSKVSITSYKMDPKISKVSIISQREQNVSKASITSNQKPDHNVSKASITSNQKREQNVSKASHSPHQKFESPGVDTARERQLLQVREKYQKILQKPENQRTSVDQKFLKIIQESELKQVLNR